MWNQIDMHIHKILFMEFSVKKTTLNWVKKKYVVGLSFEIKRNVCAINEHSYQLKSFHKEFKRLHSFETIPFNGAA